MDSDPEVVRFIAVPWTDAAEHKAFIAARTRGPYPHGQGYWTVRQKSAPARFLGWILLMPLDAVGPEIEIGWRLVRAAWSRGYATEAATPVLRHALNTLGLAEVIADIDPANTGSVGVARKLGFRPAGEVPFNGRVVMRYVAGPAGLPNAFH